MHGPAFTLRIPWLQALATCLQLNAVEIARLRAARGVQLSRRQSSAASSAVAAATSAHAAAITNSASASAAADPTAAFAPPAAPAVPAAPESTIEGELCQRPNPTLSSPTPTP